MKNQPIDYTDVVIQDMCEILITHKNPWPSDFTKRKKLEFLDKIIAYLTDTQQYERCGILTDMKERIVNEPINKSKATKRE